MIVKYTFYGIPEIAVEVAVPKLPNIELDALTVTGIRSQIQDIVTTLNGEEKNTPDKIATTIYKKTKNNPNWTLTLIIIKIKLDDGEIELNYSREEMITRELFSQQQNTQT
jgi:hypothetical protein